MNPPAGQLGWVDPKQARNVTPNVNFTPPASPQLTQATVILARVGSEGIFASEITPPVDQYFAQYLEQIKEKSRPRNWNCIARKSKCSARFSSKRA